MVAVRRCKKCVLPENYPGIEFNEQGVCRYCATHRERRYLGGEALRQRIESFLEGKEDRNRDYDCVLGVSGGRDSTYLLHYLVKALDLRVLAYFSDNGFTPEQTRQNLRNTTDILGVELVTEEQDHLRKCLKHHVLSWMHRPSPAMIGVLCTGCRLGMDLGIYNCARKNEIPVIVMGGTPFESRGYKTSIMRANPKSSKHSSFVLGYLSQVARNPTWALNPTCLVTQIREYYYHYYRKIATRTDGDILRVSPFASYIRWKEDEIVSTIKSELEWEKNPHVESSWRGDCDVALLKSYLYRRTLGFNDKDDGLSSLIRDGQISREEALERLEKEGEIPEAVIEGVLAKLGLGYSDLEVALRKVRES
jgi:hypothetical protein